MTRKKEIENLRRACMSFPEAELEQIDEKAEKEGKTRSEFVRSVMSNALPKKSEDEHIDE